MKLYSPANNYKLEKILFASKLTGNKVHHIEVPFDHKNKQFIAQYPNYTLPCLQLAQGSFIFGSNAIVLSLFEQSTSRLEFFDQSQIYQWLQLAQKELQNSTGIIFIHQQKNEIISEQQLKKASQNIIKTLKMVEQRLKLRTYLVGNSISAADIVIFSNIKVIKESFEKQLKNLTNLKRWISNLQFVHIQVSTN